MVGNDADASSGAGIGARGGLVGGHAARMDEVIVGVEFRGRPTVPSSTSARVVTALTGVGFAVEILTGGEICGEVGGALVPIGMADDGLMTRGVGQHHVKYSCGQRRRDRYHLPILPAHENSAGGRD
ncbi:hypothetical protein HYQ46_010497 [Verticillium longisporum]|nr:hypothetical protein HYQ46_010497 [Verticillium longisporum]